MKEITKPTLGEKFNKWEIIDIIPIYKNSQRYFKVKCECGTESLVHWSSLRLGKTKQCTSCFRLQRRGSLKIGDTFKNYTVIDNIPIIKNSTSLWKSQCTCGNIQYMTYTSLTSNKRWFKCKKCALSENGDIKAMKTPQIGNLRQPFINKIKSKAIQRGIEFSEDLNVEYLWDLYLKQDKKCALTGEILEMTPYQYRKKLGIDDNLSLDRIDSSKGYIKGNVQWVTKQVNVSKHVLSNEEFINLCEQVVKHANQQPSISLKTYEGSETNS